MKNSDSKQMNYVKLKPLIYLIPVYPKIYWLFQNRRSNERRVNVRFPAGLRHCPVTLVCASALMQWRRAMLLTMVVGATDWSSSKEEGSRRVGVPVSRAPQRVSTNE